MEFSKKQLEFLSNILEEDITSNNIEFSLKAKNYMISWLNRKPDWAKEVKFDIKRRK